MDSTGIRSVTDWASLLVVPVNGTRKPSYELEISLKYLAYSLTRKLSMVIRVKEILQGMAVCLEPIKPFLKGHTPIGLDKDGYMLYSTISAAERVVQEDPQLAAKILASCMELFLDSAERDEEEPELPPP